MKKKIVSQQGSESEYKNNLGCQTEYVKSCLVRHIRESNLTPGDKLPSQAELRDTLKVGSETIRRAVFALRDIGVVELRGNHGVFLSSSSDADGSLGRKIGVVCSRGDISRHESAFRNFLACALHDRGAQELLFLPKTGSAAKATSSRKITSSDSIDCYPGLRRNIQYKELNGLILTVPLGTSDLTACRENGIPYVYCPFDSEPGGVDWNIAFASDCIKKGIAHLEKCGCRRPVFLELGTMVPGVEKDGAPTAAELDGHGANTPARAAELYAALKKNQCPDGVVIPDEKAALAFAAALLFKGVVPPKMVVWRVAQFPVDLPFEPEGIFSFDYRELAERTVELLFRQFKKGSYMPESIRCAPLFFEKGKPVPDRA